MSEICNIEPANRKETLLKAILEKVAEGGGGGGGGATSVTLAASGDNLSGDISLANLKTALSNGVVLLSFPTDGNADERVVAEYTDDSTNGLRIGVFSEDEYIVYSVVDDGNNGITLAVVSSKKLGTAIVAANTFEMMALGQALNDIVQTCIMNEGSIQAKQYENTAFKNLTARIHAAFQTYNNVYIDVNGRKSIIAAKDETSVQTTLATVESVPSVGSFAVNLVLILNEDTTTGQLYAVGSAKQLTVVS